MKMREFSDFLAESIEILSSFSDNLSFQTILWNILGLIEREFQTKALGGRGGM